MLRALEGKTLLVTGGTGFIGTHLAHRLRRIPGIRLVLLARQPAPAVYHEDVQQEDIRHDDVTWVTSSLREVSSHVWREAGIDKIDIVFHLGAFIPKTGAEANQVDRVYEDNLWGTRALLENLPSTPERIIFSSTIDVYAPVEDGTALCETSALGPGSLYGASKLFCEHLLQTHAQAEGYGLAIVRYGHIFGPGEEAYRKLIPQTICQLLRDESPVLYGDGSAERDYLDVEDAVEATLRAATSEAAKLGPVNIVRGESKSIRDVVEILVDLTGFSGGIKYMTDKPTGHSLRFDSRKMHELLGAWPLVPLQEGLKREVEYFKSLQSLRRHTHGT